MKLVLPHKRKLTLSSASNHHKERLEFARKFHAAVYKNALEPFVQALGADELEQHFRNPEYSYRPVTSDGGGNMYYVHSATKNMALSVEFTDCSTNSNLSASVSVLNPWTDRKTVVIDASASEDLDPAQFATDRSKLARKVGGTVVSSIKQQIAQDMKSLTAHLQSLDGQRKFYKSVIDCYKKDPNSVKAPDLDSASKAAKKSRS